ncbi:hypothetical protein [Enterococcus faecium]|uniref:hypothetical protein n=1 Tax=Enterococcus faecium TaxID=1352 RepID=UPI0002A2E2BF|nr:hypothetical protein [Enterococcus faecium]ELA93960.1 hypothetical protein OIA_05143 [Enterococcus faecium EnGen0018]
MLIQEGMKLSTVDVNGEPCTGKVVGFGKNTFVIEDKTDYGIERYLISKKEFQKEGHTFPRYSPKKDFNNHTIL